MVQQLSTLAILLENPSLVPSTCFRQFTAACISSYRDSDTLFWPPQTPTHIHTHTSPLTCAMAHR